MSVQFFSVLCSVLICVNSAFAKTKEAESQKASNEALAKYINSFGTIDELTEGMQISGILTSSERQEVMQKMKSMGVNANEKLRPVKANGNELRIGKTVRLVMTLDGKVKTGEGRFIKRPESSSVLDLFSNAVDAQTKREIGAYAILVGVAEAGVVDAVEAAQSGLAYTADHLVRFVTGDVLIPSFAAVNYVAGGAVEGLWAIRNWIANGKVQCFGSHYEVSGFYKRQTPNDTWEELASKPDLCKRSEPGRRTSEFKYLFEGHSETLCRVSHTGFSTLHKALEGNKDAQYFVKKAAVEEALGAPAPKCTQETAQKLRDKMIEKIKNEMRAIEAGKESRILNQDEPFQKRNEGIH